jgi:hypothetical protein
VIRVIVVVRVIVESRRLEARRGIERRLVVLLAVGPRLESRRVHQVDVVGDLDAVASALGGVDHPPHEIQRDRATADAQPLGCERQAVTGLEEREAGQRDDAGLRTVLRQLVGSGAGRRRG